MIPRQMEGFLRKRLPDDIWRNRLERRDEMAFLAFGPLDVEQLARLDIKVDNLGPRLVVCMWQEEGPFEIGGYLVVDNLAMGSPSMGGIRMLPDLFPATIHNLARGMTLKNAAANLPYGGGKAGIVASSRLSPEDRTRVVRGFAKLIHRYHDIYLPGPDVGTNDEDMRTVAEENGLDNALSKPADMGGNRIDQLGAAGGGCIIALEALLREMPRLRALPQFADLEVPSAESLSVLIQGFGAVGAHAARMLGDLLPKSRVVGISDAEGCLFDAKGLPTEQLFQMREKHGLVTRPYFQDYLARLPRDECTAKFSTCPDDLLRESAFCFIPAAPIANYLDTTADTHPSMTTDRIGRWSVIVEGANTYSPDPARKAARARMERAVYRQQGILIATDYLVNSGGVIYAAQERLIKTPPHLRIPDDRLGNPQAVNDWLSTHASELEALAESRRKAASTYRDRVIRRNMKELVDLLLTDADMLPCEAAERISVRRIAASEQDRTAADIMEPVPTVGSSSTVREVAGLLIESDGSLVAVVSKGGDLVGVVTEWDITQAAARGTSQDAPLEKIMTRQVHSAQPEDSILELIRKLEFHGISAMPVVADGAVVGMVSADLLARRSLLRLLQSQTS